MFLKKNIKNETKGNFYLGVELEINYNAFTILNVLYIPTEKEFLTGEVIN